MRVLKIIHGYPPAYNAGSEVYSRSLCEVLANYCQLSVFTREEVYFLPDFSVRSSEEGGIWFHRLNMAREKDGYHHPKVDAALADVLDSYPVDVAHIGHLNHLSTGLVAVLRQRRIPILFTLHDFWLMCPRGQFLQVNFGYTEFYQLCSGQEDAKCAQLCYNRYFSGNPAEEAEDHAYWTNWIARRMAATRLLAAQVNLFLAPSQYLRQRFIRDFAIPPERILYLDYGFPTFRLSPLPHKEKKHFVFGYIGTHIPAKGVDLLIKAFKRLPAEAELWIWGRPEAKNTAALQDLAANSPNPVYFKGEYDNEDLREQVFAQIDAIVVPSIWGENSPLVIHEAQACRLPVITADTGGMAELVEHQVNGLLFRHRDEDHLLEQLAFAAANPRLMRQLGQRGYLADPAGNVPDMEQHAREIISIYQQLIASNEQPETLAIDAGYQP